MGSAETCCIVQQWSCLISVCKAKLNVVTSLMHLCTDTHSILRELMETGKLICAVCIPIDLHSPRSTFVFQIGAPKKQVVRLLPTTSMVETYVVSSRGCEVPG